MTNAINVAAATKGATELTILGIEVQPGQGLLLGTLPTEVYTVTVVDGSRGTITPPLRRALEEGCPAAVYPDADTAGDAMVAALKAEVRSRRTTLAAAEVRVAQQGELLAEGERAHAVRVADALLCGEKIPAKPPALAALQAADAPTTAALVDIRGRLLVAEDQVRGAADRELDRRVRAEYATQGAVVHAAVRQLAISLAQLRSAAGKNLADHLLAGVTVHLSDGCLRARQARLARVMAPGDNLGLSFSIDAVHTGAAQAAGWPTFEDIKTLAQEISP